MNQNTKKNDAKINKYPPIVNECYNKGGKKAYMKPSMEVYPLCDKILGPEGGVSGTVEEWDYGGEL